MEHRPVKAGRFLLCFLTMARESLLPVAQGGVFLQLHSLTSRLFLWTCIKKIKRVFGLESV